MWFFSFWLRPFVCPITQYPSTSAACERVWWFICWIMLSGTLKLSPDDECASPSPFQIGRRWFHSPSPRQRSTHLEPIRTLLSQQRKVGASQMGKTYEKTNSFRDVSKWNLCLWVFSKKLWVVSIHKFWISTRCSLLWDKGRCLYLHHVFKCTAVTFLLFFFF